MAKTTGLKDLLTVTEEVTLGLTPSTGPLAAEGVRLVNGTTRRFYQSSDTFENPELLDTYDVTELLQDKAKAGEFEFTVMVKPSGTAGTAPQSGLLNCFKSVFGRSVNNPGVDHRFKLLRAIDTRPSESIFFKTDDGLVQQNAGALFTKMVMNVKARGADSIAQATFSGKFMRQRWAGKTITAAGSTTTAVNLATGTGKFYEAGGQITIGALTPNPTIITSVAGDVLTVPTLSGAPGTSVAVGGYMPTITDSGFRVAGWRGVPTVSAVPFPIMSATVTLESFPEIIEDEKDGTNFPASFKDGTQKRNATIEITHHMDSTVIGGQGQQTDFYAQFQVAILLIIGDQAGKIITISAPKCELMEKPTIDSSSNVLMTRKYRCLASASFDDAIEMIFT